MGRKIWTPESEVSLTFVKPGFLEKAREVYKYLDGLLGITDTDYSATDQVMICPLKEIMEEHYKGVLHLPFAGKMIGEFVKNGLVARVYSGNGIVDAIVDATGVTDPSQCVPGTVREHFSNDVMAVALKEGRPVKNVIHRSRNEKEGWEEYLRFKRFLGI